MSTSGKSKKNEIGIVGEDLILDGTIHSEDKMIINGTVKGAVTGNEEITVGKSGRVHGKIAGGMVMVAGYVEGDMSIQDQLEITATGNVKGEIQVPAGRLVIREGARITGQCTITPTPKSFSS